MASFLRIPSDHIKQPQLKTIKLRKIHFPKHSNIVVLGEAISLKDSKNCYSVLPLSPVHTKQVVFIQTASCVQLYTHSEKWRAIFSERKKILKKARQTGEDQSDTTRHLVQKLAVLLARGNASLLLNRMPSFSSPDITGVE